jgi:uncharacterized membrane protein YhaH (DUF805 family)
MGFGEAIGAFYSGYFDFENRAIRSEYWWAVLFKTLVYIALGVLMLVLAASMGGVDTSDGEVGFVLGIILIVLFYIGNLIPNIAITVRRFHDQDKSGWMYLLVFIPYVGRLVVLIFMCLDGTHGDNRFGSDPLGDNVYDTFS